VDERERALELIERSNDELRRLLPAGTDVFDVHTHVGDDIDGMQGSGPELVGIMDDYGISRAYTFCLDEPDRHPAFRAANDRTLRTAAASNGRLIPFVRLDLNETPLEEAVRCLDAGARGIKLHPRAQGFTATDERLGPVFELAAERRVPILIHGGRGLPPIADGLSRLVERNPGTVLIIAHAGIADLAGLAESLGGRRGVVFDTSTWSPVDLLDFHRRVPPEQLVYASDYPYGQQPSSLLIALKTAIHSGFSEAALRAMLAGTANAIADGQELPEPSSPVGSSELRQPLQLARIHQYLSMAMPLLWMRQQDTIGVLGLALNASIERDGHVEASERIHDLLSAARDLWAVLPSAEDAGTQQSSLRLAYRLIHLADIEAVTGG
jgi:predicted TIM-barrel fold metal-dependent hydrolase